MVKQKNYRPEIDSLRAFSVLMVIFFHLEFKFFEIDLNMTGVNGGETVQLNGPALEIASSATSIIDFNNSTSQLSNLIALNQS